MSPLIRSLIAAGAMVTAAAAQPAAAQSLLDQAREAVQDAQRSIEDAARDAGRDASDFLADNPDLNRDIMDLGKRMGLPGFDDTKPYAGASLEVAPASAAPGATVRLTAAGLAGNVKVTAGFGATANEATPVATGVSNDRGAVAIDAAVPAAVRPGDSGVFVIETENGRTRLVSEPFAVTNPGPPPGTRVEVDGTLSNEGVECPTLRGDDGALYSLTDPAAGGFRPGDRVHVAGEVAGMSLCMQGIPLTGTTIGPVAKK